MTTRLSVGDAASAAGRFLAAEWRLLAPVAFAFLALPSAAAQLLAPAPTNMSGTAGQLQPGAIWVVPVGLLGLTAALAICILAARPGTSVGEALARALRRLWVAVAAAAIILLAVTLATVVFIVVGVSAGVGTLALTQVGALLMVVAGAVAYARLLMLLPVAAVEDLSPLATLRRAWALGRGHFWRFAGSLLLLGLAAGLVLIATVQVLGVVAILLGAATGAAAAAKTVMALLVASLGAAVNTAFYALLATIHRMLSAGAPR